MNSLSFTRRNHSALFAVIPAHGSGDGSMMSTLTVFTNLKVADLPKETHLPVVLRKIGATTKPTSGTAENGRAQTGEPDAHLFQKTPASYFLRRDGRSGTG